MITPYLIASYPRSGSTWLRFILTNLIYPDQEHNFHTVNATTPALEDWAGMVHSYPRPEFYKTHSLHASSRVIHVYRHVGDVLLSEFWYKRKFHDDKRLFVEFLLADDFGKGWREHFNHYFPCTLSLGYDEIGDPEKIHRLVEAVSPGRWSLEQVEVAISNSSFTEMQKAEDKGLGIYPIGDPSIRFVREGVSGQWENLEEEVKQVIVDKNFIQLRALGYV